MFSSGLQHECPKHCAVIENFVFSFRGRIKSQGLTLAETNVPDNLKNRGGLRQIFVLGDARHARVSGVRGQRRIRDGEENRQRVERNTGDNLAVGATP